jgi:TPR repeat protein
VYHYKGKYGFPQDFVKALEFWHRSAKLGHAESYHNIGDAYLNGRGVTRDMKKAEYYWEIAAMNGDIFSRFNLGMKEQQAGNMERAKKHYMIAVKCGEIDALANLQHLYLSGYATSEEYSDAERSYKEYVDEIKSDQRDMAAAATDENAYYTPY